MADHQYMGKPSDVKLPHQQLMLAVVIIAILVLLGVVAFGVGGHVIANKGLGVGAWGALRVGPREGACGRKVEGACGHRESFKTNSSGAGVGLWDTAGGQMGLGGQDTTITGWEGARYGVDKVAHL